MRSLDLTVTPHTKINSKGIIDLSVKDKAMKHLKGNLRGQGLGRAFLEMTSHHEHDPLKN